MTISILASGASLAAPTASPSGPADLAKCHAVKDGAVRLRCYDALPALPSAVGAVTAPAASDSKDKFVAKWSGSSEMRTRPFHVDGPWELQWNTARGYFSITLHRLSGRGPMQDLLANGIADGSSSSYQPSGGDFYIEFEAMQAWSARVVSIPASAISEAKEDEEPLIPVEGDQSGLPPCDGPGASDEIKQLVEKSPMGQMMHISVLNVGTIKSRKIKDGMAICNAPLMTNGGEMSYDFQYYRKDGNVYVYGRPTPDK